MFLSRLPEAKIKILALKVKALVKVVLSFSLFLGENIAGPFLKIQCEISIITEI